ncbi:MAG TPA: hypothetical protein VGG75_14785 [Trebonia sp.]|jgi:hypothetical protein
MSTNPAWVPGTNTTAEASIKSARDIALGLRALEQSAQAAAVDERLQRELLAGRLLGGVGVALAITDLQRTGRLPACGTEGWARLVDLAENGQVGIAPVLLIGDGDFACQPVVESRIRGRAAAPVPAPDLRPKQAAEKPASLAAEIASWGPLR